MPLIIYLIGFILAYILLRSYLRKEAKEMGFKYGWSTVSYSFILSFFSWAAVIGALFILLIETDKKPPKWL